MRSHQSSVLRFTLAAFALLVTGVFASGGCALTMSYDDYKDQSDAAAGGGSGGGGGTGATGAVGTGATGGGTGGVGGSTGGVSGTGASGATGGTGGGGPTCTDGLKNGNEIGVDCGGSCPGCPNATPCTASSDCGSGYCIEQVCCSAACAGTCESCKDGATVGTCGPIAAGTDPANECAGQDTCDGSGVCGCSNGKQSGTETGVDCGGPCAPCGGNCSDGIKNNGEADIDCGGPCATKCAAGKTCGQPSDCASNVCYNGTCCQPDSTAVTCGAKNCGNVTNNCGQSVSCGTCPPATPSCISNVCQCVDNGQACAGKVCGTAVNNCGVTVSCGPPGPQLCGNCGTQSCTGGTWGACTGQGVCSPTNTQECNCGGSQTCNNSCQWGACNKTAPDFQNNKSHCGQCYWCCAKPGGEGIDPNCNPGGAAFQCTCGTCSYIPPGNCGTVCKVSACNADACKAQACQGSCGGCV